MSDTAIVGLIEGLQKKQKDPVLSISSDDVIRLDVLLSKSRSKKPNDKKNIQFKEYRPALLRKMRLYSSMSDEKYIAAIAVVEESFWGKSGKSGSSFFVNYEDSLVIKTVRRSEVHTLLHVLQGYISHMTSGPSIMTHCYGIYRIRRHYGMRKETHLVVSNNVVPSARCVQTFDIKGSAVGRNGDELVLKDNDVRKLMETQKPLWNLSNENHKEKIALSLQRDVNFLAHHNLMDFSLCCCPLFEGEQSFGYPIQEGRKEKAVCVGVIDWLQNYNTKKRLACAWKSVTHFGQRHGLSTMNPMDYGERFQQFVRDCFGLEIDKPYETTSVETKDI